jgi:hypothetical protein
MARPQPPGRYGDAVWNPPDADEPTSEIYRLMPPRRHSGTGPPDDRQWRQKLRARVRPFSLRALAWVGTLVTLTVAGVLSLVIYALLTRH